MLNSLNKDFITAGMGCLGRGGRFIEMGKVGAWSPEQVRASRHGVFITERGRTWTVKPS